RSVLAAKPPRPLCSGTVVSQSTPINVLCEKDPPRATAVLLARGALVRVEFSPLSYHRTLISGAQTFRSSGHALKSSGAARAPVLHVLRRQYHAFPQCCNVLCCAGSRRVVGKPDGTFPGAGRGARVD